MKKLILVFMLSSAPALAGERIYLNPDGTVIDPECKYRIADLLDAREHGNVSGELKNRAINAHTDVCNAQRAQRMRAADSDSWNRTTDAIEREAREKREADARARETESRIRQNNSWARQNDAWSNYLNRRKP